MSKQRTLPIELGCELAAQFVPSSKRESNNPDVIAEIAVNRYQAVQKPEELAEFLSIVKQKRPQTIVEIGTANAGTLFALSQVAPDNALLVSIDMPRGEGGGGYKLRDEFSFARRRVGNQTMRFIRADSHDVRNTKYSTINRLKRFIGNRAIDCLFIDGDHTYNGSRDDFENYHPLIEGGGIAAFHDIVPNPHDDRIEVDEVWSMLKKADQFALREIIDPAPYRDMMPAESGGIGIVHIPRLPLGKLSLH